MRTHSIALLAGAGMIAAALAPVAAAPQRGSDGVTPHERAALSVGLQTADKGNAGKTLRPSGANPQLALVPDPSVIDYAGWKRYLAAKGEQRQARLENKMTALAPPLVVDEDEPAGTRGSNDSTATAQPVPGFGTAAHRNPRARVLGDLSNQEVSSDTVPANTEDDGSIPLAGDTGITGSGEGINTTATIGDGPHGSAGSDSGDFDFYSLDADAGDSLTVDIDTPTGSLDSVVVLFDDAGEIVNVNDDSDGFDSLLTHTFEDAGTYYVMVTGYLSLPEDPFDSGSGDGADSEGPYNVDITVAEVDLDFYAFRLRKGDVLGASVEGSATSLTVYDPGSVNVHGSTQDATYIYPSNSPLPGGGNAVNDHVADQRGWHYLAVAGGDGAYDVTVEAYRPGLENNPPVQTLFLDFNGARINTGIWGGPGVRTLSPLRAFLGRWGLTNADLNPLITAIVAEVRESIKQDMVASGLNDDFKIKIKNSRDHADPWGKPNVSRIIVGGTIEQSGIDTIGIAQSIDPGNFGTEESALVLLDLLSEPAGPTYSLNTYLTSASNRVGFVGQAVGNVTSHEGGHFFGNWHVDQFNAEANLMDQGGNFPLLYGVGPDNIGGSADDPDVDFGEDEFNPNEGFTGTEDTLGRLVGVLTE